MSSITRKEFMELLDNYIEIETSLAKMKTNQESIRGISDSFLTLIVSKNLRASSEELNYLFNSDKDFLDKIEQKTKERNKLRKRIDEILYTYEIV